MPRDMDLVRELMLWLDDFDPDEATLLCAPFDDLGLSGWNDKQIGRHLQWIQEAGLIIGEPYPARDYGMTIERISWAGCDFVDSVRDPAVWKQTKDGAAKAGSWTFDLLKDMAKGYVKMKLKGVVPGLDL